MTRSRSASRLVTTAARADADPYPSTRTTSLAAPTGARQSACQKAPLSANARSESQTQDVRSCDRHRDPANDPAADFRRQSVLQLQCSLSESTGGGRRMSDLHGFEAQMDLLGFEGAEVSAASSQRR